MHYAPGEILPGVLNVQSLLLIYGHLYGLPYTYLLSITEILVLAIMVVHSNWQKRCVCVCVCVCVTFKVSISEAYIPSIFGLTYDCF